MGVAGIGPDQLKLLQQMTKANQKTATTKKGGKLNASFNVATNATSLSTDLSASTETFTFKPFTMSSYFSGSRMGSLPSFTGLTKAEPSITEDELRQAVIEMAQKDAGSGKQFGENGPALTSLINRLVCGVSPDRKGIIERAAGGSMIPIDHSNTVMGQLIDDKTGEMTAFYTPGGGWVLGRLTQAENEVAGPFYRLYNDVFFGKNSDEWEKTGTNGAANQASSETTTEKSVDYSA